MLGFISTSVEESTGHKMRIQARFQKDLGNEWTQKRVFSHPALFLRHKLFLALSEKRKEERLETVARRLQEQSVHAVVFSNTTPQMRLPRIPRAGASYLNAYLAGDIGAYVAERAGATAYCQFSSLGQLEERAVLTLAHHYRYLMVEAGRDTDFLCQALRQKYGLPIVKAPTQRQIRDANFALLWKNTAQNMELDRNCLVFSPMNVRKNAGGRRIKSMDLGLPEEYKREMPEGFPVNPILSQGLKWGSILPENLKIQRILLDN